MSHWRKKRILSVLLVNMRKKHLNLLSVPQQIASIWRKNFWSTHACLSHIKKSLINVLYFFNENNCWGVTMVKLQYSFNKALKKIKYTALFWLLVGPKQKLFLKCHGEYFKIGGVKNCNIWSPLIPNCKLQTPNYFLKTWNKE